MVLIVGVVFYAFQVIGNDNSSGFTATDAVPVATAQVATAQSPVVTQSAPVAQPTVDRMAEIRACVQQANDAYTETWNSNCQRGYDACMTPYTADGITINQSQQLCYSQWGGSCSLGNAVAAQLSLNLQRDKQDCYREY